MEKRAAFHTLGCKVNAYETQLMEGAMEEAGYTIVPFGEQADVYVVNTCSVTNIADRKSRQMLHRARALNPDALIAAAGCYVQAAADSLKRDGAVDVLIGTAEKKDIARIIEDCLRRRAEEQGSGGQRSEGQKSEGPEAAGDDRKGAGGVYSCVGDISVPRPYEDPASLRMTGRTRAVLKIQDGCNQFCTYCIIPYVRGRIRSRRFPEIREEAERLLSQGFRELVLTGIHLSSYGRDLPEEEEVRSLAEVLKGLDDLPGLQRLRIGSLEPQIVTESFAEMLSSLKHLCPHFHLSLQSGSGTVLKRMNRHYTPEEFLKGAGLLKERFPGCAVTADVIVGFPGETEEEFEETLEFVRRVGFYELHIFPYSPRKGTRAASMPGQLTRKEKAVRAARLEEVANAQSRAFRENLIGQEIEILTEEPMEAEGRAFLTGCTGSYVRAALPAENAKTNRLIRGTAVRFLTEDVLELVPAVKNLSDAQ